MQSVLLWLDPWATVNTLTSSIEVPLAIFLGGFASGYLVSVWVHVQTKQELQRSVAILVTLVWLFSTISSVAVDGYSTSIYIHAAFGGVTGYLYAGDSPLTQLIVPTGERQATNERRSGGEP